MRLIAWAMSGSSPSQPTKIWPASICWARYPLIFSLGAKIQEAFARIVWNMGLPGTIETLQANQHPGDPAFHEAEFHLGKFVEDAVKSEPPKEII